MKNVAPSALSHVLEWDSRFFGFGVARINSEKLDGTRLSEELKRLWGNGIELVYWATDPEDQQTQQAAVEAGGFLADRKVTYVKSISAESGRCGAPANVDIAVYEPKDAEPKLYELAVQSGKYSRFAVDPMFPRDLFLKLYREWIRKSISGEMSQAVLVSRREGVISGLTTLGALGGCGDIGLVAVAQEARGRGLGTALVSAAGRWFSAREVTKARVVTQKDNIEACRLYEKCGYHQENLVYFYHIWRRK